MSEMKFTRGVWIVLFESFALLFSIIAGTVYFVNHKVALVSILLLWVALILCALVLRLKLINHHWTVRSSNYLCWLIAIPSTLFCIYLAHVEVENPMPEPEPIKPRPWQPPELPRGCTNVIVWFGAEYSSVPILQAEISPTTNGTKFLIKDLPPQWQNMESLTNVFTNYNRRLRYEYLRVESVMGNIGGIPIEYPVNPYVVSNRLYVNAEIPFVNEKRIIVMSDDMDDLKLPPLWDRNYNADTYEIVTSRTNPVLQVFYTKPNEIHVNAIYVLSPTNILAAWEFRPTIISPRVSFWATNTNTGEVISGTNISSGVFWDTNNVYDLPPLNRATLFKYPSRIYPGISANPPSSLVRRIRRPLMIVLLTIALYLVIDIIKGWRLRSAKN